MKCFICLESNEPLIESCPRHGCHNLKVHPTCLQQLVERGSSTCAICGFHYDVRPERPERPERPLAREIDDDSCLIPVHICMFMTIPLTFTLGVGVLYVIWMLREQMEAALALGLCVGFVFVVAISVQCQLIYTFGHAR